MLYKHLQSKKHNTTTTTKIQQASIQVYECICGKQYNHRASLWNHKKICSFIQLELEIKQDKSEEVPSNNKDVMIEKLEKS